MGNNDKKRVFLNGNSFERVKNEDSLFYKSSLILTMITKIFEKFYDK